MVEHGVWDLTDGNERDSLRTSAMSLSQSNETSPWVLTLKTEANLTGINFDTPMGIKLQSMSHGLQGMRLHRKELVLCDINFVMLLK